MDTQEERRIEHEIHRSTASNDPFAAAVRTTRMPMIITDPYQSDNPIIFVNDAFLKLTGYVRDEIVGENCRFLQGPETNRDDVTRVRNAIARREAIEVDLLNYRKDGSTFWNRLLVSPVFDEDGRLTYFFASQFDVTNDRRRVEELVASHDRIEAEVERRMLELVQHEQRTRFALGAAGLGLWTLDLATRRLVVSRQCKINYGYPLDKVMGLEDARAAAHPDDRAGAEEQIASAVRSGSDFDVEYRVLTDIGETRWIEIRGRVVLDASDQPLSLTGVSMNVTARKEAEEHRRLLARELNHRVKNSLATAQAVFAQSLRSASSVEEARDIVSGRIGALSAAQDLLTQAGFSSASLEGTVRTAIEPFDGGAFRVGGPRIVLGARAVSAFSLALHELATNAAKYGALSVPDGSVTISWTIEPSDAGPRLVFHWTESGGPPVTPPSRTGFGSRVVGMLMETETSGKARIEFRPHGIAYEVAAPMAALVDASE